MMAKLKSRSPRAPLIALEARASQEGVNQARAIMGEFSDRVYSELESIEMSLAYQNGDTIFTHQNGAWPQALELVKAASLAPVGSAFRLAVGNLLEFHLPPKGWEGTFIIQFINRWIPEEQDHRLSEFFDLKAGSTSDSNEYWVGLEPLAAIAFLLERGVRPSPKLRYISDTPPDALYASALASLQERSILTDQLKPGAPTRPRSL